MKVKDTIVSWFKDGHKRLIIIAVLVSPIYYKMFDYDPVPFVNFDPSTSYVTPYIFPIDLVLMTIGLSVFTAAVFTMLIDLIGSKF